MAYMGRKGAAAPLTSADIQNNTITSAKIVADTILASDLADEVGVETTHHKIPVHANDAARNSAIGSPANGMIIYNTASGALQQYNASGWVLIDSPPTVTSLNYPGDDTALDTVGEYNDATCDYNNDPTITHDTNTKMAVGMSVSGTGIPAGATIASVTSTTAFELSASTTGGAVTNGTLTFNTQTLIITGTNFKVGATVTIDGTAPSTITRDSSTQITVTGTPAKTAGTKVGGLVVTNPSGLAGSINVDYSALPAWTTASDLGTLYIDSSPISTIDLAATSATSYALTTGSLPPGLSMSTSTGDITGTITGTTYTTYNITVTATDAEAQSSPRLFNIITSTYPTGGIISTPTGFRVHKFILGMSESFDFVVSSNQNVDYLVVAGGGGGGADATHGGGGWYAGGGGAGGFRTGTGFAVTAQTYTITVGAGGAGGASASANGVAGSPSIFSSITSAGGGYGAGSPGTSCRNGGSGGSGGGAGGGSSGSGSGGAGNTPSTSPAQGFAGGTSGYTTAGGGGGASGVGTNTSQSTSAGGAGTANSYSGTSVTYSVGGGVKNAGAGTANTGNGGGGGKGNGTSGDAGGSGIVIIRYAV